MLKDLDYLHIAIEASKVGAKVALKYFENPLEILRKEDKSPVTIADKETEKEIMNYILGQDPGTKFVGEESGGSIKEREFWIIDPIDGTRSFIRGLHHWCIMIAYVKNGDPLVSVLYFPIPNFVYTARKNNGSFLNGKRINVSEINDLELAYLGFSNPKSYKEKTGLLNLITKVENSRSPETTYSTCLVAEGKFDICIDNQAKDWDTIPVKLLIEEAGGKLSNMEGRNWTHGDKGYIATNSALHNKVLEIFLNR